MAQFRKKPITVEAWQHTTYGEGIYTKTKGVCQSQTCYQQNNFMHVHTIHDNQICAVQEGDWIIPEPDGKHFYPVKPDIFEATYERVTE